MGNSVVYIKPYDAEVEYLESTGTQYIDTGIVPTSDISFEIEFQQVSFTYRYVPVAHCGEYYNSSDTFGFAIYDNSPYSAILSYYGTFSNIPVGHNKFNIGDRLNVKYRRGDTNIVLTNKSSGITDSNSLDTTFTNGSRTLYILYGNTETDDLRHPSAMKLYFCKIYNGSTLIRDFIPVRIGQVGYLYDKVSKQLFANKGTGNFILGNDVSNAVIPQQRCVLYFGNQRCVGYERIYEEYEWLVGDGSAYIDTGIIYPAERFNIRTYLINNNDNYNPSVEGSFSQIAFTNRAGSATNSYIHINPRKDEKLYYCDFQISREFVPWIEGIPTTIDVSMNHVNTNASSLQLFYSDRIWTTIPWDGSIGELVIQSQSSSVGSHFIPCKLLVSIPAILDGNGIARQAGECGMWDKVSNKFYGNVANSGTFTVKGPKCYEEYKWLRVTLPYGNNVYTYVPINSDNFEFTTIIESGSNLGHFATNHYCYYTNWDTNKDISIWNTLDRVTENIIDVGSSTLVFESSATDFKVNGISITKYGFPVKNLIYYSKSADLSKLISSITVDGSVRYVPCKLLQSIPAILDGNGIARSAGECGMWDKVNDKFYGNVASDGSFTVSND